MKIVGITGGIGSGKSTVSRYLRELGYVVIDADGIARELSSDPAVLAEIRNFFGDDVITPDGSLDRKRMAEIVFSDLGRKEMLENIITSKVIKNVTDIISDYRKGCLHAAKDDIVFLDAPTLFETGAERLTDEVWLVTCDIKTRLERASLRDSASAEELKRRIASQMPEDEKAEKADVIIVNDGDKEELFGKIDSLLTAQHANRIGLDRLK